jgi:hypothetical protein
LGYIKQLCGRAKTGGPVKFLSFLGVYVIMKNLAYVIMFRGFCQLVMTLYCELAAPSGEAAAQGAFCLPFPGQLTIFAR